MPQVIHIKGRSPHSADENINQGEASQLQKGISHCMRKKGHEGSEAN